MTEREGLKPCKCGGLGQIRDFRIQFAVQCLVCGHTEYSESYTHLDHVGCDCDTDEEADKVQQMAFEAIDWNRVTNNAIAAWNRRAEG